jgi:hypothetical protein
MQGPPGYGPVMVLSKSHLQSIGMGWSQVQNCIHSKLGFKIGIGTHRFCALVAVAP